MSMKMRYFTLFFIITEIILLSLTSWQFLRHQEKQHLEQQMNSRLAKPAVDWQQVDLSQSFYHTKLEGSFDHSRSQLVAHQRLGAQNGFRLFTPYLLKDHKTEVIVDRGFVPMQKLTESLMESLKPYPSLQSQPLLAVVKYYQPKQSFFKAPDIFKRDELMVQMKADPSQIKQKKGINRLKFYVQLDYPTADNLIASVTPPRAQIPHLQYALTWLSLFVLIGALYFALRRSKA